MKWIKIDVELPAHDIVQQIKVDGKKLCLIKKNEEVFVVQNSCPHAGGILSGGWCENEYLICPIHRYGYHLKTGRGLEGQGDYIDIYPVETRADGLYVGIKENWIRSLFKK